MLYSLLFSFNSLSISSSCCSAVAFVFFFLVVMKAALAYVDSLEGIGRWDDLSLIGE
jgi:hypothetical protein